MDEPVALERLAEGPCGVLGHPLAVAGDALELLPPGGILLLRRQLSRQRRISLRPGDHRLQGDDHQIGHAVSISGRVDDPGERRDIDDRIASVGLAVVIKLELNGLDRIGYLEDLIIHEEAAQRVDREG